MNHGIVVEMSKIKHENQVSSNSILDFFEANNELIADNKSSMCLSDPKIVLDKNVVSHYFKSKQVPKILPTAFSRHTDNADCNSTTFKKKKILVTSDKCTDHIRNTLTVVKKVSSNRNMLIANEEVILEEPISNQNNNIICNINEYNTQKSIKIDTLDDSINTQLLDNHNDKIYACNISDFEANHNFINNENTVLIKGEPVDLECGDDILFTNGNNHYNKSTEASEDETIEMECGDDILFKNGANHYSDDSATLPESIEMECGDDILYTNGAGYYNSDEDNADESQDFIDNYESKQISLLSDQSKHELEIKEEKVPFNDMFEEKQETEFFYDECNYKTLIKQEFQNYVVTQEPKHENDITICEKCGRAFDNLSLLKKHQFEAYGLEYFYTCKFCPSTSWYSSTLKTHIKEVHSNELGEENIDDIMEAITKHKQVEKSASDDSSLKNIEKKVPDKPTPRKAIKTAAKQSKKKKIYIQYKEMERILVASCIECNRVPEFVRGKADPRCSKCKNEYSFQCRKCSKFYFNYESAMVHSKRYCKNRTVKVNKTHENSENTFPNKTPTKQFFKTLCAVCNEKSEEKEYNTVRVCWKCKSNIIKYECLICARAFRLKNSVRRHSRICQQNWRDCLISSSLATLALIDHNYYCTQMSEPKVITIATQITELRGSQKTSTKRIYPGKKSR